MRIYHQKSKIQKKLPYAISSMVLGILSIMLCTFFGAGMVISLIAKKNIRKDEELFFKDPLSYKKSYIFVKVAKITRVIGFWVSFGFIFFWIFYIGMILLYAVSHNPGGY